MKLGNLFPMLALGFLAVGCQDYDAGVTPDFFTQKKYAETFAEKFGEIDPNQDWNMATQVVANADFGEGVNGTLKIYSKSVTAWDSEYLAHADVVDGKASITFDVVKGAKVLHARLEKDGRVLESGYYDVIDGVMNIGSFTQTRAAGDVPTATAYTYSTSRMIPEAVAALVNGGYHSYTELNAATGTSYTNYAGSITTTQIPKLYKLNGVDYSNHDAGFTKEDLQPIFSTYTNNERLTIDGVFKEGVDHINQYVKTGVLDPDVTFWVAEEGEVELDIMWRGTQYNDFFGYYYYPENTTMTAEELWSNTNKYILIDAEGHMIEQVSSLTQRRDKDYLGNLGEWYDIDGMACANVTDWAPAETGLRGTKLKLVYYGDNPATPSNGTYTFPKGTKLGFFICHKGSDAEVSGDKFFFSDCVLNYQLRYRKHWGDDDLDTNRPFAAKFNYDGRTYVGFADESGDCDLNDLVYIIKNVNPPAADITPDDITTAKSASWHIACEDLGGTFDYDFNDVVFKVQHVGGDDYAIVTPVAVGGTLETTATFCGVEMGNTHGLIGETPGTAYGAGNGTPEINKRKVVATRVSVATDFSMTKAFSNFTLTTGGKTHTVISGEQYGDQYKAPQVILVPGTWQWPTENTDIREAYPKFAQWVSNANIVDWTDPVPGKVYGEVIQRDEPVNPDLQNPVITATPTGAQQMMLYGSPLDINLSTTYGTIEGVNISTSNSNIVGISYSAPYLTLTANGVGAAKITVRVPKTATSNAGVYSFVVTVTPPDLSTYGDAIPDAKISNVNNAIVFDKTVFAGLADAVLTVFFSSSFMNQTEAVANIRKGDSWFDAFTDAPVWKKVDGTVVEHVKEAGIYQLYLSESNLSELRNHLGLSISNGSIGDVVLDGTRNGLDENIQVAAPSGTGWQEVSLEMSGNMIELTNIPAMEFGGDLYVGTTTNFTNCYGAKLSSLSNSQHNLAYDRTSSSIVVNGMSSYVTAGSSKFSIGTVEYGANDANGDPAKFKAWVRSLEGPDISSFGTKILSANEGTATRTNENIDLSAYGSTGAIVTVIANRLVDNNLGTIQVGSFQTSNINESSYKVVQTQIAASSCTSSVYVRSTNMNIYEVYVTAITEDILITNEKSKYSSNIVVQSSRTTNAVTIPAVQIGETGAQIYVVYSGNGNLSAVNATPSPVNVSGVSSVTLESIAASTDVTLTPSAGVNIEAVFVKHNPAALATHNILDGVEYSSSSTIPIPATSFSVADAQVSSAQIIVRVQPTNWNGTIELSNMGDWYYLYYVDLTAGGTFLLTDDQLKEYQKNGCKLDVKVYGGSVTASVTIKLY